MNFFGSFMENFKAYYIPAVQIFLWSLSVKTNNFGKNEPS